jgi:hypothetical protein
MVTMVPPATTTASSICKNAHVQHLQSKHHHIPAEQPTKAEIACVLIPLAATSHTCYTYCCIKLNISHLPKLLPKPKNSANGTLTAAQPRGLHTAVHNP